MRVRTLLAFLPVAVAATFVPSASAEFESQTCTAAGTPDATIYTVLGKAYRPAGAMEYAFADVNSTPTGLDICLRAQTFAGGTYTWEGLTAHIPNTYTTSASIVSDSDTASCTNVVADDNVNGVPYRIATEQSGNSTAVCVTLGAENIRLIGTVNGPAATPTVVEDPVGVGQVYPRSPAWPAAGLESGQCDDPAEAGSSYVVAGADSSFLRRDFSNSVCFRGQRNTNGVGGRVDAFTVGLFLLVTPSAGECDTTTFQTGMPAPRDVRVLTASGGGFVCVKANNTELTVHLNQGGQAPPSLHLD